jgi:acyl-CoA thioesterase-1
MSRMKKHVWRVLLNGILGCLAGSCALSGSGSPPPPLEEPFRVLLLGDSISMGYHDEVVRLLGGRAVVRRPMNSNGKGKANCAGTNNGVVRLDQWLAMDGGPWDVIHFNFGLHDLKRVHPQTGKNSDDPADPHQAPPERYEAQLRDITARLQATGARLVFATTTPVPEGDLRPWRAPQDAVDYNAVARRVMDEAGVPINDLYAFALPLLAEIQQPENVHFTKDGSRALATEVVRAILEVAGHSTGE